MKRNLLTVCLLFVLIILSGCGKEADEITTTVATTEAIETTETTTEPVVITTTKTTTEKVTEKKETATKPATEKSETTTAVEITESTTEKLNVCTIEINCRTILENKDKLKKNAIEKVPSDGIILETVDIAVNEGDTVLDILLRASEKKGVEVSYTDMPMFNSCYIEGIGGIYEKDCGGASGWMYSVNGEFPQVGANAYTVSEGDRIAFLYTCDGGKDVGDR